MYWNRLNDVLRARYGTKVYKLALSSGCSCPNRDGTLGTRGCIFCDGAGAFAAAGEISRQLTDARNRVAAKAGPGQSTSLIFSPSPTPMARWSVSGRCIGRRWRRRMW